MNRSILTSSEGMILKTIATLFHAILLIFRESTFRLYLSLSALALLLLLSPPFLPTSSSALAYSRNYPR